MHYDVVEPRLGEDVRCRVIKHRAPNGALRHAVEGRVLEVAEVIKRRAPNGALRLKTGVGGHGLVGVIKNRAPNGAFRLSDIRFSVTVTIQP